MPERDAEAIRRDLFKLADDPTRHDLDVKKLEPKSAGRYRQRRGKWRAVFEFDRSAQRIDVLRIDDRKDAY
jgi:mRNA-degrading endonuclease RelE of RelBE toxin-antitoxin system